MLFTMRAAWAQADALTASDDVAEIAAALARGALQGARGNSGVILSQILRGLADVTASAAADRAGVLADIGAALFGAALRHSVGLVVSSMGEDVPGTIVSVLQDAAGAAEDAAADGSELADVVLGGRRRRGRLTGQDHRRNSMSWPRPAWWMPAVAACWYSWTR